MIFYEALHKAARHAGRFAAAFGAGRSVSLCRELTKLHEEIKNDPLVRPWLTIKKTTPAASMCWSWPVPTLAVEAGRCADFEEAVAAARAFCRQTACPRCRRQTGRRWDTV